MFKGNFTEEFKRDALVLIVERGYRVAQVSQGLGVPNMWTNNLMPPLTHGSPRI
jgi:transposase-like protein